MKQRLCVLVIPFAGLGCTEENGSVGQATTASASAEPSSNPPFVEPAQTSSSTPPASGTSPVGSSASPDPGEPPAEPEPDAAGEPEPEAEAEPEPDPPGPGPFEGPNEEPEPSSAPNAGAGGTAGEGPSPTGGVGGASFDAGSGANAGAGAEPPLEGCEGGPLDGPLPDCSPEFEETGDFYEDCVARINQLRWECQCLPPLERWVEGEACADQHAQYDYEQDEPHAGISDGICENGGGSQNECPDYNPNFDVINFCLQQMWDEGPGEDFQAHGHYINMSSTTVSKVACGLYVTPEGNFWSVQNFSR